MVHPVFEDSSDRNHSIKSVKSGERSLSDRIASPIDRVAAFVVDLFILGLITPLVTSPLQRQMSLYQMTSQVYEYFVSLVFIGIVFFLAHIVYHVGFYKFRGATPGKILFNIKVIDIVTEKNPSFYSSLLRAIVLLFDLVLVLPLFAVFSDPLRRTPHDRLANTAVVTLSSRRMLLPTEFEVKLGQWLSIFMLLSAALGMSAFVYYHLPEEKVLIRGIAGDDTPAAMLGCDVISESFDENKNRSKSNPKEKPAEARLRHALTFFAADIIDTDCLEEEANAFFRENRESSIAYLVQGVAKAENDSEAHQYLDEACRLEPQGEPCAFSKIIKAWEKKDFSVTFNELEKIKETASSYIKLWAIRSFENAKEYERELRWVQEFDEPGSYSEFMALRKAIALWGVHRRDEARAVVDTISDYVEADQSLSLNSWFCLQELEESCAGTHGNSCRRVTDSLNHSESWIQQLASVAYLRNEECQNQGKVDYNGLIEKSEDENVRTLFAIAAIERQGRKEEAIQLYRDLQGRKDAGEVVQFESRARWISSLNKKAQLNEAVMLWINSTAETWGWSNLGERIFHKAFDLKDFGNAVRVGQKVLQVDPWNKTLLADVVRTAYFDKQFELANTLWSNQRNPPSLDGERRPASVNEVPLEKILAEVKKRLNK